MKRTVFLLLLGEETTKNKVVLMDTVLPHVEIFETVSNEPFGNPFREDGVLHTQFTFEGGHQYPMFYSSLEELQDIKEWYWGNPED